MRSSKHFLQFVLLTSLGILPRACFAQFDALPDHDAQWVTHIYDGPNFYGEETWSLSVVPGDTIIDAEPYTKLFLGSFPSGAIWDNGLGQVHYHNFSDHQTYILCDFDVSPGDTVNNVYNEPYEVSPLYVTGVDSVQFAGTWRKRIGISESSTSSIAASYWVQGIGGVEGAVWSGGLLSTCACVTVSLSYRLYCMSASDTIQYGTDEGMPGSCFLVQGLPQPSTEATTLIAFVDPLSNELVLTGPGSSNQLIELFSSDGRMILRNRAVSGRLALSDIQNGIYLVRIMTGQRLLSKRVVIER